MAYGIWLSYNNQKESIQLPVNPGSLEIGDGGNSQTYDVAGLGEINVIKSPKLTEYSFSSFFPAQPYHFMAVDKDHLLHPSTYVAYLLKWMATKRPIRFVFTGDDFDINTPISIESFEWKEVAGAGGDIEYSLKLKKYVFYAPLEITQKSSASGTPQLQKSSTAPRANDKETPKTYTLASGDTLWKVAKKTLNNGDRWPEIQTLNNIPAAKLKSLSVGMILKIPQGGQGGVSLA